jgi:hypothetical protein
MAESDRWERIRMLRALREGEHLPVFSGDPEAEHNSKVLDDLQDDGYARGPAKRAHAAAGIYFSTHDIRITEKGEERLRQAEAAQEADGLVVASQEQREAVETVIRAIEVALNKGELDGLSEEDRLVVEAEDQTLQATLRSPKPNRGVMKAALNAIKFVIQGVPSGVLGNAIYAALVHFT